MIFQVVLDANIKKQLKALRRAGGRAGLIADHAESVMKKLALTEEGDLKQLVRLTKHGEARIKSSMKFDLLDGYRLIAIKQGHDLTFVCVGPHDECDRWIRNNSGMRSVPQKRGTQAISVQECAFATEPDEEALELEPAYDDDPLTEDIDDRILRKIFCGLTGG